MAKSMYLIPYSNENRSLENYVIYDIQFFNLPGNNSKKGINIISNSFKTLSIVRPEMIKNQVHKLLAEKTVALLQAGNLVFEGKITFTIKNIPIGQIISLNSIRKIKNYLTINKILREIDLPEEERNKAITTGYKNLDILQKRSDENFLKTHFITKGGFKGNSVQKVPTNQGIEIFKSPFSLPNEITALIGFFVDGQIMSSTINQNLSISLEKSDDLVNHLGLVINPYDSEI